MLTPPEGTAGMQTPEKGILLNHEQEWSMPLVRAWMKPWKYCAELKKPGTKGTILCDAVYMQWSEQAHLETESGLVFA